MLTVNLRTSKFYGIKAANSEIFSFSFDLSIKMHEKRQRKLRKE